MGSGIVMKGADGAVVRALALDLTRHMIQLLAVQLCSDGGVEQQHALAVQPGWQHDIFRMEPWPGCCFGCSPGGHRDRLRCILAYRTHPSSVKLELRQVLVRLKDRSEMSPLTWGCPCTSGSPWSTHFARLDTEPDALSCSTTVVCYTLKLRQADVLSVADRAQLAGTGAHHGAQMSDRTEADL